MKNHKLNLAIVLNQNGKQQQNANNLVSPSSTSSNLNRNMKQASKINKPTLDNKLSSTTSDLLKSSSNGSDWSSNDVIKNTGQKVKPSNSTQDLSSDRRRHILMVSLLIVGLVVAIISLSSLVLLPSFVSHQISKKLVLKNDSILLERWSKPNLPMLFKVWMFDVENAREVIDKRGTKPKLREIGPFVFKLRRHKDIVSFAADNLYYTERRIYHFQPELSCCAINTTITLPNIPLVAVVDRALGYQLPLVSRFVPRLINRAIQSLREQLFIRRQVREILFDGYDVELLKMISRVGSLVGLPQTQQRFAILKGKNNTWRPELDGIWAINTGERNPKRLGRVYSWNSYRKLPFWAPNSYCNMINGSDGTLFVPPIRQDQPLYIFNQEICRSVTLAFKQESQVRSIDAYRFVLNPLNFARTIPASKSKLVQSATRPRNTPSLPASTGEQQNLVREIQEQEARSEAKLNPYACFCDRKSTNLNGVNICEFDGLIDMSKCNKQAQAIFGSMPHFYQTDSRLLNQVEGLKPNASKHLTYVDIEPNTGIVLGGKRRVQLNLMIKHNKEVDGFENISDMIVPLVWFEESAMMTEELADKFKSKYRDPIRRVNTILLSLLVSSMLLFAINFGLLASNGSVRKSYIWKPNKQRDKPQKQANNAGQTGASNRAHLDTIKRRDSEVGLIDSQSLMDSDNKRAASTTEISSPLLATKGQDSSGPNLISALDSPRGALQQQLARNGTDLKPIDGNRLQKQQIQPNSTIQFDSETSKTLASESMATTRVNL